MVAESQTAEAGPAHLELGCLDWEGGLIRLRQAVGATGIPSILMKRHHGIAIVVGLLDKRLALPRQYEAPNIARARAGRLEETAIGTETGHARRREVDDIALRRSDLTRIERTLRQPEPAARRSRELVREEVRILDAKAGQEDFALIRLSVTIRIT